MRNHRIIIGNAVHALSRTVKRHGEGDLLPFISHKFRITLRILPTFPIFYVFSWKNTPVNRDYLIYTDMC